MVIPQILMSVLLVLVAVVPTEPVWTPLVVSPASATLVTLETGHSVSVSAIRFQYHVHSAAGCYACLEKLSCSLL